MADISKEISNFKNAAYGEEVRGSMISLAEKINDETEQNTENTKNAINKAESALEKANSAINEAQTTLSEANKAKSAAQSSATSAAGAVSSASQSAAAAGESAAAAKGSAAAAAKSAEEAAGIANFDGTANTVTATDTQGFVGNKGGKTFVQDLLDKIAEIIVNKVVTTDTFQTQLGKYLVNNGLATVAGKTALDAAYGKILADQVTKLNSDLLKVKVVKYSVACGTPVTNGTTMPFKGTLDLYNQPEYVPNCKALIPIAAYKDSSYGIMAITSNRYLNVNGDNLTYTCVVAYLF